MLLDTCALHNQLSDDAAVGISLVHSRHLYQLLLGHKNLNSSEFDVLIHLHGWLSGFTNHLIEQFRNRHATCSGHTAYKLLVV